MIPLIFFLHIPKCSGSTLNHIISNNYKKIYKVSWDKTNPRHYTNINKSRDTSVFNDSEIVSGHFPYGLHKVLHDHNCAKYLTMLRDPVARSVSTFNYLQHDSTYVNNNHKLARLLRDMTLYNFYSEFNEDIPNHIYTDNCMVRYLSGVGESKGYDKLTCDDLDKAKDNLSLMIFGITEEFNKSILLFRKNLGWRSIGYINKRIGSVKKQKLSPKEEQLLMVRNQYDIELYEFAIQLFYERTSGIAENDLRKYQKHLAIYPVFNSIRSIVARLTK